MNYQLPYKRYLKDLKAKKPESVAASLIDLKELLLRGNTMIQVKVLVLISRPDFSCEVFQATNEILLEQIPECNASPRDIRASGHFDWDYVHSNKNLGVFQTAR